VQVSFVVPKEIAQAVPCVRVVVSGQEKVDVSALCQFGGVGSGETGRVGRSLALEQDKEGG
jgi:hypothetical protein